MFQYIAIKPLLHYIMQLYLHHLGLFVYNYLKNNSKNFEKISQLEKFIKTTITLFVSTQNTFFLHEMKDICFYLFLAKLCQMALFRMNAIFGVKNVILKKFIIFKLFAYLFQSRIIQKSGLICKLEKIHPEITGVFIAVVIKQ